MKTGAKVLLPLITSAFLLLTTTNPIFAHPGRTASDGCHYCRTNCAKWGEVQGARHCHGGASIQVAPLTPIPTQKASLKPIVLRTIKPTPTQTPFVEKTADPRILGTETEQPIALTPAPTAIPKLTAGGTVAGLGFMAIIFGLPIWLLRKIIVRHNRRAAS